MLTLPFLLQRYALFLLALLTLGLTPIASHANEGALLAGDVLQSAASHYPQVLAALQSQQSARAEIRQQEGAFDARIDQESSWRMGGFYDGRQIDTTIVKPLPQLNSRIYGGYRISEGSFPIYEDKLFTNDSGEFRIGAALSLLRNSLIDERRAALNRARFDSEIADIDLLLTRINVQQNALNAYWRWVAEGKKLAVLQSILALMEDRQVGLEKRLARGDVAKIYLKENQQYIVQRKSQIAQAEQTVNEAANSLSLFYRNPQGQPVVPSKNQLPPAFPETQTALDIDQLRSAISRHPHLQKLHQAMLNEQQNLKLGENSLLPKADLSLEYSDDNGSGSLSRAPAESVAKLSISIPLQQNFARGRMDKAKAEISRLELSQQLREEELRAQLATLMVALQTAEETVILTRQEISLAQQMEKAERQRFARGDSDFFLINMRETALANARLSYIRSQAQYHQTLAQMNALTLNTEALAIADETNRVPTPPAPTLIDEEYQDITVEPLS